MLILDKMPQFVIATLTLNAVKAKNPRIYGFFACCRRLRMTNQYFLEKEPKK